ncbi:hypothetical protein HM1_2013 [Heliomicrobium modesticaldum Ice1]|uniref:DUF4145 domain-containing protein n=1 Tax=Heliobacterium modesticaldum (strain ATCC 51547 / Ice1) TaxID=498761 RepID=B0TG74_HELMI|nr:DUF4145 domain-containing protein [Heliomicrobium modesticaldum]ABZ84570.1 hypothetical protein HM1_2013 [Heliomicrobium modesticaldum Ice1]
MNCPNCFVEFYFQEEEKKHVKNLKRDGYGYLLSYGTCPKCGQLIVCLNEGRTNFDESGLTVFPEKTEEDSVIYPKAILKNFPPSVPQDIASEYNEAMLVLNHSPKSSAALSRRLLQKILRVYLKIEKKDLFTEIKDFVNTNPPEYIKNSIDAVRNVGNFAAHPLKEKTTDIIVDVTVDEAKWLLEIIDALIEYSIVRPTKDNERKKKLNDKLSNLAEPTHL